MKYKRSLLSIALATIVLVSMCTLSVSAANGGRANVKAPATLVGTNPIVAAPAAAAAAVDNLDVFVRGDDNALWWRHYDGSSWTAWESLGGALTSSPAAIAGSTSGTGATIVCVRGTDGAIWARFSSGGTWINWEPLGGQLYDGTTAAPYIAVDTSGNGQVGVFATGTDQALWHQSYNLAAIMAGTPSAGASGWETLGGVLTSSPAAAAASSSAVLAFGRGSDGALWYQAHSSAGWSGWTTLGGQLLAGTGPATAVSTKIDVFVIGTDHQTYQRGYTGAWSGWATLGGASNYSPAATGEGTSYVDLFVTGTDGNLWWRYGPSTTTLSDWLNVGPGP